MKTNNSCNALPPDWIYKPYLIITWWQHLINKQQITGPLHIKGPLDQHALSSGVSQICNGEAGVCHHLLRVESIPHGQKEQQLTYLVIKYHGSN